MNETEFECMLEREGKIYNITHIHIAFFTNRHVSFFLFFFLLRLIRVDFFCVWIVRHLAHTHILTHSHIILDPLMPNTQRYLRRDEKPRIFIGPYENARRQQHEVAPKRQRERENERTRASERKTRHTRAYREKEHTGNFHSTFSTHNLVHNTAAKFLDSQCDFIWNGHRSHSKFLV